MRNITWNPDLVIGRCRGWSPVRGIYPEWVLCWCVLLLPVLAGCRIAAEGQNAQGVRLFEQGRWESAIDQFQQASVNDPENADAIYNLAAVHHHRARTLKNRSEFDQAEEQYRRCLRIAPNHVDAHRALAVLLAATERVELAEQHLRRWAAQSPELSDARVELARFYEERQQPEQAKRFLQEAIAIDQNNARAWAALGRLRERSGDRNQALANYQRGYALDPTQAPLAQRIAALSNGGRGVPAPGGEGRTRLVDVERTPVPAGQRR